MDAHVWLVLMALSYLVQTYQSAQLLTSEEIANFDTSTEKNETDTRGIEIDELMPDKGEDVASLPDSSHIKKHNRYALPKHNSMMASNNVTRESFFAPSDESYEHFSKLAADSYTMADVEKYERENDIQLVFKLWPKSVIPYEFDDEIKGNKEQNSVIYGAMKEWQSKTCLKFQPFSSSLAAELGHDQKMRFRADLQGCNSQIGMVGPKWKNLVQQTVSMQRNRPIPGSRGRYKGCFFHRIALHEIGHAIGFPHEQVRPDRDSFVDINFQNVKPNQVHNFKKQGSPVTDREPYDYLSIMHYGKYEFSVQPDVLITIKPKNKCYNDVIGTREHLSYFDHKSVNEAYGCNAGCGSCGKGCYGTKTTTNPTCQCFCYDEASDPCINKMPKKATPDIATSQVGRRCSKEQEPLACSTLQKINTKEYIRRLCAMEHMKTKCCYLCGVDS